MLYHSNSHGADPKVLRSAFIKCLKFALASTKEMKICIHTKNQLKRHVIKEAMGEKFIKTLLKGNISEMGVTILLETQRQVNNTQMVVLAPHISSQYLEEVIAQNGNADVVYLPWTEEELNNYLNKHPNSIAI